MIALVWEGPAGNARHCWHENGNMRLCHRPSGLFCYTFLHFYEPVKILLDGELVLTKPHACIMIAPHTPQTYYTLTPLTHDWAHIDDTTARLWSNAGLKFDALYYPHTYDFITEYMQAIERENYAKDIGYAHVIDAKFTEMFFQIARSLNAPLTDMQTRYVHQLRQLRQEMQSHLNEKWSVSRIADTLGISNAYVHLLYKNIYGTTPTADIISMRIASAEQQLSLSSNSIYEIALSLGYASPDHFIRQFKQFVGQTPGAYRKKHIPSPR